MARAHSTPGSCNVRLWILLLTFFACHSLRAQTSPVRPDSAAAGYFIQPAPAVPGIAYDYNAAIPRSERLSPVAKGAAVLLTGAGVWVAAFALADEPLQQYTQSHRTLVADKVAYMVQPLGRQAYMAPLAGAAFAGGLLLKDSNLQKAGMVSLGSILLSAVVTGTLKNQFHRHRPSNTTENHVFDGPMLRTDNTSLPSSHTATAFALATSVATVYGHEYKYVPPIAYGVATLVGLSRINDNAHWATDGMAGAPVGFLSAKATNYIDEMASQKLQIRRQRRLLFMPQPGIGSGGLSATLLF